MNIVSKENAGVIIALIVSVLLIVFVGKFVASNNAKTEEVNTKMWDQVTVETTPAS